MWEHLENSAVATGLEKVSFHSNPKERQCQRMFKLLHNCTHLTQQQSNALNSLSRLQQYVNWKLPDDQAGFRKGRQPEIKLPTSIGSSKNQKSSRKISAKSLQSCPTLCDPIDGSQPGSPVPGFSRQEHWSGLPFPSPVHESEKWKWKVKVKSLSRVRLFATPWIVAYQASLSMGFSRQEYWSGVPLPSKKVLNFL